ncbi:MAG: CopG family transcriptional regulator [Akkermansiaceae bacterium]
MPTKERKRATIYLEPELHRAVKTKAGMANATISELINEALRDSLREDLADIKTLEDTQDEPTISLQEVLHDLDLDHLLTQK